MSDELKKEVANLSKKLAELQDHQAIQNVVLNYAKSLDRLDAELLKTVFHDDAIIHHGVNVDYADDFVKRAMALEASFPIVQHAVSNHYIEIDGDQAHS